MIELRPLDQRKIRELAEIQLTPYSLRSDSSAVVIVCHTVQSIDDITAEAGLLFFKAHPRICCSTLMHHYKTRLPVQKLALLLDGKILPSLTSVGEMRQGDKYIILRAVQLQTKTRGSVEQPIVIDSEEEIVSDSDTTSTASEADSDDRSRFSFDNAAAQKSSESGDGIFPTLEALANMSSEHGTSQSKACLQDDINMGSDGPEMADPQYFARLKAFRKARKATEDDRFLHTQHGEHVDFEMDVDDLRGTGIQDRANQPENGGLLSSDKLMAFRQLRRTMQTPSPERSPSFSSDFFKNKTEETYGERQSHETPRRKSTPPPPQGSGQKSLSAIETSRADDVPVVDNQFSPIPKASYRNALQGVEQFEKTGSCAAVTYIELEIRIDALTCTPAEKRYYLCEPEYECKICEKWIHLMPWTRFDASSQPLCTWHSFKHVRAGSHYGAGFEEDHPAHTMLKQINTVWHMKHHKQGLRGPRVNMDMDDPGSLDFGLDPDPRPAPDVNGICRVNQRDQPHSTEGAGASLEGTSPTPGDLFTRFFGKHKNMDLGSRARVPGLPFEPLDGWQFITRDSSAQRARHRSKSSHSAVSRNPKKRKLRRHFDTDELAEEEQSMFDKPANDPLQDYDFWNPAGNLLRLQAQEAQKASNSYRHSNDQGPNAWTSTGTEFNDAMSVDALGSPGQVGNSSDVECSGSGSIYNSNNLQLSDDESSD